MFKGNKINYLSLINKSKLQFKKKYIYNFRFIIYSHILIIDLHELHVN